MASQPEAGSNRHLGTVLALVAGYVDTLGFVALFGLFTAHVTGNFVLIGKELAGPGPGDGVLLKLLAFPAFIFAVALSRVLALAAQRRGHSAVRRLFVLQIVLLTGFMLAGLAAQIPHAVLAQSAPATANGALVIAAGLLGAMAMGVQNAQGRLELATLVPTTVMTGNVTQLVIDLVDLLLAFFSTGNKTPNHTSSNTGTNAAINAATNAAGSAANNATGKVAANAATTTASNSGSNTASSSPADAALLAARSRIARMLPPMLGFTFGAIGGAFAYVAASFWALLLPLALLLWAAFTTGEKHVR